MRARVFAAAAVLLVACEQPEPRAPLEQVPLPEPRPTTLTSGEIAIGQSDEYADTDPSALTDFREALDGHGTWTDDDSYGTVWVPNADEVGADFTPYDTAGHWVYDDEWVWVSDWSWGWAPFHYGRWVWIGGRGWCWIPGRRYAGAWVVWRVGDDDVAWVAWAPMPPIWIWRGHVAVGIPYPPPPRYVACPRRDVFEHDVHRHVVVGTPAAPIVHETRPFVRASPTVVPPSHPIPQPSMQGPPPAMLRIEPNRVARPAPSDDWLRARQYAHPRSAAPFGAAPPTPHVVKPARPMTVPRMRNPR